MRETNYQSERYVTGVPKVSNDCLIAAKFLATRIPGEEVLSFATGIFLRGVVLLRKWLCCDEQGNSDYCKDLIPY